MGKKSDDIVIVGAGGLAKEIIGYLRECGSHRPVCLLQDAASGIATGEVLGVPVRELSGYGGSCRKALLAVGEPLHKRLIVEKCRAYGFDWVSFVHPSSSISPHAIIEGGSVVAPFAVVAGDARIAAFCLLNAGTAVAHDARIGSFTSLMPATVVAGNACLGREVMAGLGSRVLPGVTIGDRCRIAAGAAVYRDAAADHLLDGTPARASPDVFHMRKRAKLGLTD